MTMQDLIIITFIFFGGCGAVALFGNAILNYIHRPKLEPLGRYKIIAHDEGLQALLDSGIKFTEEELQEVKDYLAELQNSTTNSKGNKN